MPRAGGVYSLPTTSNYPAVVDTEIDPDDHNTTLADIADALTGSVPTDGSAAMTGDLDMASHKVKGLAAATTAGDAIRYEQVFPNVFQTKDGTLDAVAALSWVSGKPLVQFTAADTISLTLAPDVTSITVGLGSVSAPSVSFSGDSNTGIYSPSADALSLVCGGVTQIAIGNSYATFIAPIFAPAGTVGSPAIAFASDTDNGFYRIGADNIGFSLGGTKRIDYSTSLFDFSVPTRAKIAVSAETSGTLTSASSNKKVNASGNITIDGNVHAADDQMKIYAGASARTLTQGATGTPTQRLHGSSATGNLTLAARGVAVVDFISATEWVVSGDVS